MIIIFLFSELEEMCTRGIFERKKEIKTERTKKIKTKLRVKERIKKEEGDGNNENERTNKQTKTGVTG